jgi:hypothetical protein
LKLIKKGNIVRKGIRAEKNTVNGPQSEDFCFGLMTDRLCFALITITIPPYKLTQIIAYTPEIILAISKNKVKCHISQKTYDWIKGFCEYRCPAKGTRSDAPGCKYTNCR